jgi:hypothetical protein
LILEISQEFGAFKNQLGSIYNAPKKFLSVTRDLLEKNALNLEGFFLGRVKIAKFRQWVLHFRF